MTDDPREVLRVAGVDVADFDLVSAGLIPHRIVDKRDDCPQCALARIARLVAKWKDAADMRSEDAAVFEEERDKYKRQRDRALSDAEYGVLRVLPSFSPTTRKLVWKVFADLGRRYDEQLKGGQV